MAVMANPMQLEHLINLILLVKDFLQRMQISCFTAFYGPTYQRYGVPESQPLESGITHFA